MKQDGKNYEPRMKDCCDQMSPEDRMKWFKMIVRMYPEMIDCCMEYMKDMDINSMKENCQKKLPEIMKFWTGSKNDAVSDEIKETISEMMEFMGTCCSGKGDENSSDPRNQGIPVMMNCCGASMGDGEILKNKVMMNHIMRENMNCCSPPGENRTKQDNEEINENTSEDMNDNTNVEMKMDENTFYLKVETTGGHCPSGEAAGKRNIREGRIPVFSCEGGCIRGEIARLAAHMVAKEDGFARACHGEAFTIPDSALGRWVREAEKVVLIDGCFLKCHSRIMRSLIPEDRLMEFDALSHYKRYTDLFDIDDVDEEERKAVARDVADWVVAGSNILERK